MKNDCLLSVIIPVYNCEKYISTCIESFSSLDSAKIELLLVDDGSSDSSRKICEEYSKDFSNITLLRKSNGGPSSARNLGMKHATGKYIGFADSDDYVIPDVFNNTLSVLESCEADILASDFYRVSESGIVIDKVFQIDEHNPVSGNNYKLKFLSASDCHWNAWRYIYRHDYLDSIKLTFTEGVSCGEDMTFVIKALINTDNIVYYHNPFYCYRVNYGSTLMSDFSGRRTKQLINMLTLSKELLDMSDKPEADILKSKLSREYILNLSLYAEGNNDEKKEIMNALNSAKWLMTDASGAYRILAIMVRMLGVKIFSYILFLLKSVKRTLRRTVFVKIHKRAENYGEKRFWEKAIKTNFYIRTFIRFLWLKIIYGRKFQTGKHVCWRKRFNIVIEGKGHITIGDGCFFNNDCSLNALESISIGEGTLMGENVKIYDHNHRFSDPVKSFKTQGFSCAPVTIGRHCWIGSNVIILKGAHIGDNCVIGAGTVISGTVEPGTIVKSDGNYITEKIRYNISQI